MNLLAVVVIAVAWISLASWFVAIRRLLSGQRILPFEPRDEPTWGLTDLVVAFLLFILCQGAAAVAVDRAYPAPAEEGPVEEATVEEVPAEAAPAEEGPVEEAPVEDDETESGSAGSAGRLTAVRVFASSTATLVACLLSLLVVRWRTGARLAGDLGFTLRRAAYDLRVGAIAFVMLAPIVYGIQMTLVRWYPSQHPLIEFFQRNPSPLFFALCGFSAVIAAPIAEEYLFRVLLQGWLERLLTSRAAPERVLFGGRSEAPAPLDPARTADVPTASALLEDAAAAEPAANHGPRMMIAIVIGALVFALMHWSHGPDPVPLFVLALGLGYLYQRTHRILPCIVLHFLLNACTLLLLLLSLAIE